MAAESNKFASQSLPRNFALFPEAILKEIFFWLNWRSAFKFSLSFPRIWKLGQNGLWNERQKREFGGLIEPHYPNGFHNYLKAVVIDQYRKYQICKAERNKLKPNEAFNYNILDLITGVADEASGILIQHLKKTKPGQFKVIIVKDVSSLNYHDLAEEFTRLKLYNLGLFLSKPNPFWKSVV